MNYKNLNMETLKNKLMQFAKETKGLKKATSVEIDEEMGAVFFEVGNSEIEVNQVTLMLWMSNKLNIHNVIQQREQLIDFIKWKEKHWFKSDNGFNVWWSLLTNDNRNYTIEEIVAFYIKSINYP